MDAKFKTLPPNKRLSKVQALPPHKRLTLLLQQLEQHKENNNYTNPTPTSSLPAKKRRESRDPLPSFLLPQTPTSTTTTTYSLPTKKRVWALQPIDLNIDYTPPAFIQQEEILDDNIKPFIDPVESIFEEENDDDDDGIVCAVCQSTDGDPTDQIVFCDGCDIMVHQSCYGDPLTNGVPDGDWFCKQCSNPDKNNTVSCCLCPVKGSAMKPTTKEGNWAHIVCALYVPEVFFSDPDGREGIDCSSVPTWRRKRKCYVCKSVNEGCVIDCSEEKCGLAFHVTCGLNEDLCIEYREGKKKSGGGGVVAAFCGDHSEIWKKQQHTGKYKIVARE
ncbi:hypothetical protein ACFE04_006116 [Oxalis oulophora]